MRRKNLQLPLGLMDVWGEQLLAEVRPPQRVQGLRADQIKLRKKEKKTIAENHVQEKPPVARVAQEPEKVYEEVPVSEY